MFYFEKNIKNNNIWTDFGVFITLYIFNLENRRFCLHATVNRVMEIANYLTHLGSQISIHP